MLQRLLLHVVRWGVRQQLVEGDDIAGDLKRQRDQQVSVSPFKSLASQCGIVPGALGR